MKQHGLSPAVAFFDSSDRLFSKQIIYNVVICKVQSGGREMQG